MARFNKTIQDIYETYKKYYQQQVSTLAKYNLKATRPMVSLPEFETEYITYKRLKKTKYITKAIAYEHAQPLTSSQEQVMLTEAFSTYTDNQGNRYFNDALTDLLVQTDLWDKYSKILEYKQANRKLYTMIQLIKELNTKLKALGKTSYEIADLIGEAFYGS